MSVKTKQLNHDIPAQSHEQLLTCVVKANRPKEFKPEEINVTWWPSDTVRDFFTIGKCVGPLCAATRKKDSVAGSLLYSDDYLMYYHFVPYEDGHMTAEEPLSDPSDF